MEKEEKHTPPTRGATYKGIFVSGALGCFLAGLRLGGLATFCLGVLFLCALRVVAQALAEEMGNVDKAEAEAGRSRVQ